MSASPDTREPDTREPDTRDPGTRAPVDPRALRRLLGTFLTGVTVATYRRGEVVRGVTVNAFTSVSLDPPLVLLSLDRRSRTCDLLADGPWVVNILAEDQQDVALHFAGRPMDDEVRWLGHDGPAPRLADTVGHLVCRPWRVYDGGDHEIHVGEVREIAAGDGRSPLLFFRGDFPQLAPDADTPWLRSLDGPAVQHLPPAHPEETVR